MRPLALAALMLCLSCPASAAGADLWKPVYRIEASVAPADASVAGTVRARFVNRSERTLEEAVVFLFPNRFTSADEAVDDFNRPFVWPQEEFDAGSIQILAVRADGDRAEVALGGIDGVCERCVARIAIRPLASGEERTLDIEFRTEVPRRFGTFGVFEQQMTMIGGWHPYLAALDADGVWRTDLEPPVADFDVEIARPTASELVVNQAHFAAGTDPARVELRDVHFVSVLAAPRFERTETTAGATEIVLLERPKQRRSRIAPGPDQTTVLLETVRAIVERSPPTAGPMPARLLVVEAPLRMRLTASAEGALVVSDRTLKVHTLLRPFHELQLAAGVYEQALRPSIAPREPAGDYAWVAEGLAWTNGRRFVEARRPDARSVYDWIDLFNMFAVVDRFESAPRIPFVGSFFERASDADPLDAELLTFNGDGPPGRVVLGKLAARLGNESFGDVMVRCSRSELPFRRCAAEVSGQDLDAFFAQWLGPFPDLNYRLETVERNERVGSRFRTTVEVERESSRPVEEPVTVRLNGLFGPLADLTWNGEGDSGQLVAETDSRVWRAEIDPDRRLIEDRRDDNASPRAYQVVLDTANAEVSSTEFGIGGLLVGRARYDYRKDIALAGNFTNRAAGLSLGPRYHWGEPIDPTLYRQNLYLFYNFQALDKDFKDKRRPDVRTEGNLGGIGLRYDYTNVYAFDNPTRARNLRLFADWYDAALGSDFDYVQWGWNVSATHPLLGYRTLGALDILNGFSEKLGDDRVPNQGLFSLGGTRSIRGIGAEKELGRNIFLVRAELRQTIYPELDLNLLDAVVLRRSQVRLFVDSGRVDNDAGDVYDVGDFAVGVGVGLAAFYDFMGFFPSLAFLEVATRVDESDQIGKVQVLLGTRQRF